VIAALARTRTFSAFRWRNFRLYWTGAIVSLVGTWAQSTAQAYLVWELTRSPLATSLPMFFFTLPSTFLALLGGVVADRLDRRRLLLVTQGLFMVSAGVLTALTWLGALRVEHVYLLAFANGVLMAVDAPTRHSLIPRLVAPEDVPNAVGLNSLVWNASRIVGPPVGGLLYAAAGPEAAFLLNTVSYGAILYALAIMDVPGEPNGAVRATVWSDLREGLTYVWETRLVRTVILAVAVMGTFGFSYLVLMPVMASRVLGGGPAENGFLLGMVGVGATLGALTVAHLGRPAQPGRRLLVAGTVAGAALVGFAFSRLFALSALCALATGAGIIAFLSSANATVQLTVPDALRGRVMSVYSLALIGSGPLNSLLSGALGDLLGAPRAIALTGLVIIGAVAVLVQALAGTALTPAPASAAPPQRDRASSHPTA